MTPKEFKALRHDLHLTQEGMVAAIGLEGIHARRTVQRYESGKTPIQGSVKRVCEYLTMYGVIS